MRLAFVVLVGLLAFGHAALSKLVCYAITFLDAVFTLFILAPHVGPFPRPVVAVRNQTQAIPIEGCSLPYITLNFKLFIKVGYSKHGTL